MDFTSFIEVIKLEVTKQLGDGYRVRINDVQKNNGIILKGLTILQEDSNIAPTVYLNSYYEDFLTGKGTIPDIISRVLDTYNRNKISQSVNMNYFLNYQDVRQCIVYKLINTAKNKELLEDVPHMEFLDLSIVFQYLIAQEEMAIASVLIHNAHLKLWNVTTEELYETAKENTPRLLKYEIKPIAEVICDIMQAEHPEDFNRDECMEQLSDDVPMFVLSNKIRMGGAACMLYSNVLREFSNTIGSSFYIIPSSLHELMLLPANHDNEICDIRNMIKEVNDTYVSKEEILSYSLYFYDRETGEIVSL